MPGYTGKLLRVDLSRGTHEIQALREEDRTGFIGGRGLGAKILWDEQPPGIEPLNEKSLLLILTGPLTGLAPGGAQTCFAGKSPLTGRTILHSLTGGQFGPELKFAGYDGIAVTGRAPEPVYLFINNDRVEIREAKKYHGMDTFQAGEGLKEEIGDPLARVISIGPAGENLVKFASIQQEFFRSAARGGGGALMGSKNLKAVVVRGTGSITPLDPDRFFDVRRRVLEKFVDDVRKTRRGYKLSRWGSTVSQLAHSDVSEVDVKNYREGYWEEIDRVGGLAYERRVKAKSRSCFSCPVGCMQLGVIRSGPRSGVIVNPDFDSSGTIGPGLMLGSVEETSFLSRLGDQLGMDDASLGNVIGFVTECFEKGLVTRQDLGGLEPRWGDGAVAERLIHMMARREGFGGHMAEGVKHLAEMVGGGSKSFSMHVKGLEFAGYAPQAHPDRALQYAVGDRGGCHHFGLSIDEQNRRAWADSLTVCSWHHAFIRPDTYLELLNYATGMDYRPDDWPLVAERILLLSRAYNIREGMVPLRDDVLPDRVHDEPLTWGPSAGAAYPRERFAEDRRRWYLARGCDGEGVPTEARLSSLGLEFCRPALKEVQGGWKNTAAR